MADEKAYQLQIQLRLLVHHQFQQKIREMKKMLRLDLYQEVSNNE